MEIKKLYHEITIFKISSLKVASTWGDNELKRCFIFLEVVVFSNQLVKDVYWHDRVQGYKKIENVKCAIFSSYLKLQIIKPQLLNYIKQKMKGIHKQLYEYVKRSFLQIHWQNSTNTMTKQMDWFWNELAKHEKEKPKY